jgi:TonB family protein
MLPEHAMFPQPMLRSEPRPNDPSTDLAHTLEEHLLAGFPPDLALDLVLNELVVRAAAATHADAAALALTRGDQMVCRAATGKLAPGLGVPLSSRNGLSGACLQTRQPQHSADTETDPRVDRDASQRLGIRSILIVPVFRVPDDDSHVANDRSNTNEKNDKVIELMGILEVFSARPSAFSNSDQKLLEAFATQCARIRVVATELSWHKPAANFISHDFMPPPLPQVDFVSPSLASPKPPTFATNRSVPDKVPVDVRAESIANRAVESMPSLAPTPLVVPPISVSPKIIAAGPASPRSRYELWSVVIGGLAIVATIGVSFLIGSRIGWLRQATSPAWISKSAPTKATLASGPAEQDLAAVSQPANRSAEKTADGTSARASDRTWQKARQKTTTPAAASDELVVYEKGKVVFRMKPVPAKANAARSGQAGGQPVNSTTNSTSANDVARQDANAVVEASSTARIAPSQNIWLSPQEAEARLLIRTDPHFPAEAIAAHRAGNVVLEVQVAEDGSVSNIRTLSGDPLLANAAIAAVRNWRYRPYREHNRPTQFQTDVSLIFSLPN